MTTWPPTTHQDVQDVVTSLRSSATLGRRRDRPGGNVARPSSQQPAVMTSPPTVTVQAASLTVRSVADGAMTAASATLTSATAAFTTGDVGKKVTITGVGAAGATLSTFIASYTSATSVTVQTAASTTGSAKTVTIGTTKIWGLKPPVNPSSQAGPAILYSTMVYGRLGSNSNSQASLISAAAAGATTIQISANLPTGSYRLELPAPVFSDVTAPEMLTGEDITISSVTGAASPFTATLSAPLVNAHRATGTVNTATVGDGFNTTNYIVGVGEFNGQTTSATVEWITDAPTVEVIFKAQNNNTYRLMVDGQLVTALAQTVLTGGGGQPATNAGAYVTMQFGTRQQRRIRYESVNLYPAAIVTDIADSVAAPEDPAVRVLWIGDSYLTVGGNQDGIPWQASRLLGWDNVMIDQIGGTGYVANATTFTNAADRLATQVAAKPDIIVITLGLNDAFNGSYQAAVTSYLNSLYSALPSVRIYAVGPWSNGNSTNTAKQTIAQAIQAACAATGATYIDTMLGAGPSMNPWVIGTGFKGSLQGNGNADVLIDTDGTHPTRAWAVGARGSGEEYFAGRVAAGIASTLTG